jgi:peptide/nickel transport system permease protein
MSDWSTGTVAGGRAAARGAGADALGSMRAWKWPILGALFAALALIGPAIAPRSPYRSSADILQGPSMAHLLGTDTLGRDVLSRVLAGGQSLTLMSLVAGAAAVLVGGTVGLVAAYRGGWVDSVLMRLVDLLLAMPPILIILVFSTTLTVSRASVVALTALLLSPGAARVIRGVAQVIVNRDFVAAAEAAGERTIPLLWREILPNVRGRLAVELALRTGFAVLLIASLSFLGVGISPPSPDWGLAVSEGRAVITVAPWLSLSAAIPIFILIVLTNNVAGWLERRWA